MSDAEMQALNGTEGKGGCQQEATRVVFGSEESRAIIKKVNVTAVHYLNNDAIFKDLGPATEKWAQCMKERFGGDYTSPDMAREQYRPEQPRHPRTGDQRCDLPRSNRARCRTAKDGYRLT